MEGARGKRKRTDSDTASAVKQEEVAEPAAPPPREPPGPGKCQICGVDITKEIKVKCAVCRDFEMCITCFSVGAEVGTHKRDHPYNGMENAQFPFFTEDWGASDELLLLEGIENFGLGNWTDVAEHVGKPADDCQRHYYEVYITGPTAPEPDVARVLSRPKYDNGKKIEGGPANILEVVAQGVIPEVKDYIMQTKLKTAAGAASRATNAQKGKPKGGSQNLPDAAGFIPRRGDFETEWDQDAEIFIADMIFSDDDTEIERKMKIKALNVYNSRLDERALRKQFVLERGLLDVKKTQKKEKERMKEADRDNLHKRLQLFSRFMPQQEYDELVAGLARERQLRRTIEQLKQYREVGIRTVAEGLQYDQERDRREKDMLNRRARGGYFGGKNLFGAAAQAHVSALRRLKRDEALPSPLPGIAKQRDAERVAAMSALAAGDPRRLRPNNARPPPLDVQGMRGGELLSQREQELCSTLRLEPETYLRVKDTLVMEGVKRGHLRKAVARTLVKMDVNKTGRIYDFLVSAGFVAGDSPGDGDGGEGPSGGDAVASTSS
eukprot:tig00000042_g15509.t1